MMVARFVDVIAPERERDVEAQPKLRRRMARVADWMHSRLEIPVSLDEAAREAGLSSYHFLRGFRQLSVLRPISIWCACGSAGRRVSSCEPTCRSRKSPLMPASKTFPTSSARSGARRGSRPRAFERSGGLARAPIGPCGCRMRLSVRLHTLFRSPHP